MKAGVGILGPRERAVLAGLLSGLSEVEIARGLGIEAGTVRAHLMNARRVLGLPAKTRWQSLVVQSLVARIRYLERKLEGRIGDETLEAAAVDDGARVRGDMCADDPGGGPVGGAAPLARGATVAVVAARERCTRCGGRAWADWGELWCVVCGPQSWPLDPERVLELCAEVSERRGRQRVRGPSHAGAEL